jgi:hypothetical protein
VPLAYIQFKTLTTLFRLNERLLIAPSDPMPAEDMVIATGQPRA